MCTHKYTHARSTQTRSGRSHFVNHFLNPAFLYSSTEPNMGNCMKRWWDTCSALTFLYTWLMQVKSLGEIDFLFRAPCFSTTERGSKGTAKLSFFLVRALFASSCSKQFSEFQWIMITLQIKFCRCIRKRWKWLFFAITHWLNSEIVKYPSCAVRPHN